MEIGPQAPKNGIFQISYARKRDFDLCPNMEIRPQAPKNGNFQKILIFSEKVFRFRF